MKKILFFCAVIAMSTMTVMANVYKCTYYDSSATVEMDSTADTKADWSGTLTNLDGTTVRMEGVVSCSKNRGSAIGATVDVLTTATSDESTSHLNCWCKMVRPFVSKWVYVAYSGSTARCARYCSHHCATFIRDDATVRDALFLNPLTSTVK
ncbi:MAG: hypothetical protein E7009_02790 [Alphaproteobacteria bacterium]|nr:hypothetical protein [Alphaproteobacteria bacterium]